MIDFDIDPEFQEQIDWVERFTIEEIEPLDNFMRAGRTKDGNPIDRDGWRAIRAYIEDLKQQGQGPGTMGIPSGSGSWWSGSGPGKTLPAE